MVESLSEYYSSIIITIAVITVVDL